MKYLILIIPTLAFAFGTGTVKKIDEVQNNSETNILLNPTTGVDISYFTGNRALFSDVNGVLQESVATDTELGFLSGVTSNIQTQIDNVVGVSVTTKGDLQTYDTAPARLPVGTDGQILSANSATATGLEYIDPPSSSPTTTTGDIIYNDAGGSGTDTRLGIGSAGQVLTVNGGIPSWENATAAATFTTVTKSATTTLATANEDNVACNTGSGDVTLNLPDATGNAGLTYRITLSDATNTCTIDGDGGDTIGGDATIVLNELNDSIMITSDNANWQILSKDIHSRCQRNFLTADITTNTTDIADLRYTNLTAGKVYKVIIQPRYNFAGASDNIQFDAVNSSVVCREVAGATFGITFTSSVCHFEATNTSLTFNLASLTAGNRLEGNSGVGETSVTLCEQNDTVITTGL